jgi:predicted acetyltransferase
MIILSKLGISGGTMRKSAKAVNPRCVIALSDGIPVGWATLRITQHLMPINRTREWSEINVFVAKKFRKQGIGSTLTQVLMDSYQETKRTYAYPYNKAGEALFKKFNERIRLR